MSETTAIGWTDASANLWWGCTTVHAGCDFCYANVFASRVGKADAWEGVRYAVGSVWKMLADLQKQAARDGTFRRVFVGSMMDVGEKSLPVSDWKGRPLGITTGDLRDRLCRDVVPATPNLHYQFLTKRPGNIPKVVPAEWLYDWPENVITGASVVDQATADTLLPQLMEVPCRRFVSYEPAIGPVDLSPWLDAGYESGGPQGWVASPSLDWVIVGGESGGKRRPCEVEWFRAVVEECRRTGTPVFVKQDAAPYPGEQGRIPDSLWALKQFPEPRKAVSR